MASAVVTWEKVRSYMRSTCGVVFSAEQIYLLDARLGTLVTAHGFTSIDEFVNAACSGKKGPASAMIDAMTTHETFFFRDTNFWQCMQNVVLPEIVAKNQPIKIWSAACSTGQEPYSIAMLVREKWPEAASRLEIIATDISESSVAQARAGLYTTFEVNRGLGAARLVRFFEKAEGGFRIRDELRNSIRWETGNLLADTYPPMNCDIVFCRNVLIYFDDKDQKVVLSRLRRAAKPTGIVAVGTTEALKGSMLGPGLYLNQSLTTDEAKNDQTA